MTLAQKVDLVLCVVIFMILVYRRSLFFLYMPYILAFEVSSGHFGALRQYN